MNSAKSATAQAGKLSGLSGRDLFTYNPELLLGDEDEDEEGGDDEWDFAMLRVRTENERQAKETERCVSPPSSSSSTTVSVSSRIRDTDDLHYLTACERWTLPTAR